MGAGQHRILCCFSNFWDMSSYNSSVTTVELTCPGVAVAVWEGARSISAPTVVVSCNAASAAQRHGMQQINTDRLMADGSQVKMRGTAAAWEQGLSCTRRLHAAPLFQMLLCWLLQQAECGNRLAARQDAAQQCYMYMQKQFAEDTRGLSLKCLPAADKFCQGWFVLTLPV